MRVDSLEIGAWGFIINILKATRFDDDFIVLPKRASNQDLITSSSWAG
jgi:hypothetical protein